MDLIIFGILLLLTFSGLFFGWILARLISEELLFLLIPLRHFNSFVFSLILFFSLYPILYLYSIIISILVFTLLLFFERNIFSNVYLDSIIYISLSILLYLSLLSDSILNISVLIFIYGLNLSYINAASFIDKTVSKKTSKNGAADNYVKYLNFSLFKKFLINYCSYFLVGLLLFLVF